MPGVNAPSDSLTDLLKGYANSSFFPEQCKLHREKLITSQNRVEKFKSLLIHAPESAKPKHMKRISKAKDQLEERQQAFYDCMDKFLPDGKKGKNANGQWW